MNGARSRAPDALVLGGGGILGEAWMSAVLAGVGDAGGFDARECDGYVGTSAGSIVAAALSAGVDPRSNLGELPEQPPAPLAPAAAAGAVEKALRLGGAAVAVAGAPLAAMTLHSTARGGAVVRRAGLGRVPRGRRSLAQLKRMVDGLGAGWDGRLRIAVVELESGRRVMLDGTGSPEATVGEAVQASCAIPGVFRPVTLDGRSYVDGGAWSPTNLDVVEAGRGARVLCLNPTGSVNARTPLPLGAFGPISRAIATVEALALRRRGVHVDTVSPDGDSAAAMGVNLMDARARGDVIAAGFEQGRRLASRSGG